MSYLRDLEPGDPQRVGGCDVVARLSAGSRGVAYVARAPGERLVVVTVLDPAWIVASGGRPRLARDLQAARRLPRAGIARVLRYDLDGAQPYVMREFVDGPSLREYVQQHGPMDGAPVERLALASVRALGAIHRAGMVHGGVGPDTIVLGLGGPHLVSIDRVRLESAAVPGAGGPSRDGGPCGRRLSAGQAQDMVAWATTMLFAVGGSPLLEGLLAGSGRHPTVHRMLLRRARAVAAVPVPDGAPADVPAVPAGDAPADPVGDGPADPVGEPGPGGDGGARPPRTGGRRRPGRILVLGVAALFGLLAAGGVLAGLVGGRQVLGAVLGGDPGPRGAPASTAPAPGQALRGGGTGPVTTPAPTDPVTPPLTIAGVSGRWSGTLTQSDSAKLLSVLLTVRGQGDGRVMLPRLGCARTLALRESRRDRLVFRDMLVAGSRLRCARAGMVTLSRVDARTLRFDWVNAVAPFNSASGILRRM